MNRFLIHAIWLSALIGQASAQEQSRSWTHQDGRKIEGSYLSASASHVEIRRADGQVFKIPRASLSADDDAFIRSKNTAPVSKNPMLAGYDPSTENFTAPWPGAVGLDSEPVITVIEESADQKRFIYESPHFRLQSNVLLRPSLVAKVAMMFEACYELHKAVPLNNRRTRASLAPKLKASLFEDDQSYFAAGGLPETSGTYYGSRDEFLVTLTSLGVKKVGSGYMFDYNGNFNTVYHEITHQLWADLGGNTPIWMSEGFAEFMASAPYRSGRFSLTQQPRSALEYATAYGRKDTGGRALGEDITMPRLSKLMAMSQAEFYKNANANYAYGLLIVQYFILYDGEGDAARFKACIRAQQQGKSATEAQKELLAGRTHEQLEEEVSAAFRKKGIRIRFAD